MPRSPEMQPFKVTFWLGTPVSLNHPWIHLDGITAHLKYESALDREYRHLPSKSVVSQDDHAPPLYRKTNGVRHASVSLFVPDLPPYTYTMFKRFEPEGYPRRGPQKVNIGSGHYRNYMLRLVLKPCERVEFYGYGAMDRIADLLSTLTHLGGEGRDGFGQIIGLDVEPIDEDRSLVAGGIAMRPIPVKQLRSWSEAVHVAWRAPYWARESIALCAPPGAEVVMA